MEIAIFINTLLGGGAERVVANLANFLVEKNEEVTVLNYYVTDSPYQLDKRIKRAYVFPSFVNNNRVLRLIFLKLFREQIISRRVNAFFKQNKVDCCVVLLENATIDLLKRRENVSCPIIVSERSFPGEYCYKTKTMLKALATKADGFVFQTEKAREWYEESVSDSVIIPNAVNPSFLGNGVFGGKRRKTIVSVGRLIKQKNHELLIKAFSNLNRVEYTLEIYGEGPLHSQLLELISNLGLIGRVFLKGFSNDICNSIIDASLFVMSSDCEGLPNSLVEAMALGLPCISTDFDGGGVHVIIDHEVNGIIVPKRDEISLSNAMRRIIDNQQFAESLSLAAINKAKVFSPNSIYAKWHEYIKKIATIGD